jgi:hypothetical protein
MISKYRTTAVEISDDLTSRSRAQFFRALAKRPLMRDAFYFAAAIGLWIVLAYFAGT